MSARLPDEVRLSRLRESVRNASARRRQRMEHAGKSALTVWIDAGLKAALTTTAAERGTTIADTAEALLSAALTPTTTLTRVERDERIVELHRQGIAGREIARRLGIGKTTVLDVLKRMEKTT